MKEFIFTKNKESKLSFNKIKEYFVTQGLTFKNDKALCDYLRIQGWKGRYFQTHNAFVEPHLTHIFSKNETFWAASFLTKQPEAPEVENDRIYKIPYEANNLHKMLKRNKHEEITVDTPYCLISLDIECTPEDAFIGVYIKGFYPIHMELHKFVAFIKYLKSCNEYGYLFRDKKLIILNYNSEYDMMLVYHAYRLHKSLNRSLYLSEALKLSTAVLNNKKQLDLVDKYLVMFYSDYNSKTDSFELNPTKKKELLEEAVLNNVLLQTTPFPKLPEKAPNVYVYDLMTELYSTNSSDRNTGSLKYNCQLKGLTWSDDIISNVYAYNVDDLKNTYKLFHLTSHKTGLTGLQHLKIMFDMLADLPSEFQKGFLSHNLILTLYIKGTWESNFLSSRVRNYSGFVFKKALFEKHSLRETPEKLIHPCDDLITLEPTAGGLHSLKTSRFIKDSEKRLISIDADSFYPKILASKSCPLLSDITKKDLQKMINDRVVLKKAKDDRHQTLKKILNSIYGVTEKKNLGGKPYNTLFVTALATVHLLETLNHIRKYVEEVIDINTDGIILVTKAGVDIEDVVKTSNFNPEITFSHEEYCYMAYKGSGNYLIKKSTGEITAKGSWLVNSKYNMVAVNQDGIIKIAYNFLNTAEIFTAYLENKQIPKLMLSEKIQLEGEDYPITRQVSRMKYAIITDSILMSTSPTKADYDFTNPTYDEYTVIDWIINSKSLLCGKKAN